MTTTATGSVEPTLDTSLVVPEEIEHIRRVIADYRTGRIDGDAFRRFRLQNGIYGIRDRVDIHMVRIRIPFGRLTATQLEGLAVVAEHYAGGTGHITTRQNIQLYGIPLHRVADLLGDLGEIGLTTRESSGNVVRNVTTDPLAGVAPDEVFDVRPYANAVVRLLLRNPIAQNLPRKIKIAFSGSAADRAATGIHDIGALAVLREAQRGFQLFLGGGLGSNPHAAQRLEDFTPEADLLPTIEAVIRVFDRLGERKIRSKARLKFLIDQIGFETLRTLVLQERAALPLLQPQPYPAVAVNAEQIGWITRPAPAAAFTGNHHLFENGNAAAFQVWLSNNVIWQKQPDYAAVAVAVPGGNLTAFRFNALAAIARQFAQGEIFWTAAQNLLLRWVSWSDLPNLYQALRDIGLEAAGSDRLWNVIGCAGADTCNTAITTSHQLALELGRFLHARPDLSLADDLRGVDIKISGCPNACGHHHVAAIGFYGGARRVNGQQPSHYMLLLGGRILTGSAVFGTPVTSIPARRVPEAVERVLALYRAGRCDVAETFLAWVDRVGPASLKNQFEDLRSLPDPDTASKLYQDWGQTTTFKLQVKEAECAV
ncbi:MAG TPA: nitrite/sulfite reductase [Phototrophicaceae bacterium]|nr:nitrite/sulfite reductase [Phototrophicaceae bacterium]